MMLSNGQGLPITSIGATSFHSLHNPHTTLTLKYLLLVLNITKNLIFVSQFAKITVLFFFVLIYALSNHRLPQKPCCKDHLQELVLYFLDHLMFTHSPVLVL
jgi:hypothetical protein